MRRVSGVDVSCELTHASALMVLFLSFPSFLLDTESLDYGNVLWRHDTLIFAMRRWLELGLFLKIKINLVLCMVGHMAGWQWGRTAHGRLRLAFGRMSVAWIFCHSGHPCICISDSNGGVILMPGACNPRSLKDYMQVLESCGHGCALSAGSCISGRRSSANGYLSSRPVTVPTALESGSHCYPTSSLIIQGCVITGLDVYI
jgi:hypothetical protein